MLMQHITVLIGMNFFVFIYMKDLERSSITMPFVLEVAGEVDILEVVPDVDMSIRGISQPLFCTAFAL